MEKSRYRIYKENKGDKVWWVDTDKIGEYLFSFDKKNIYNLFRDYPEKLTVDEWLTFNDENEYWMMFFKKDNIDYIMEHAEELNERGKLGLIDKLESKE